MAKLVNARDAKDFLARAGAHLLSNEAQNNLLFGISHSVAAGRYPEAFFWTLEEAGQVLAAALRTPPHPAVVSWAEPDAARALATAMAGAGVEVPGFNGTMPAAAVFAEAWALARGLRVAVRMSNLIYRLERVVRPPGAPGRARRATESDRDLLAEWLDAFAIEALHEGSDPDGAFEQAEWVLRRATAAMVWQDGDEVVSLAVAGAPTPNGVRIGPVYTPHRHRRKGYAANCVAALSAQMLADGKRFCFLYADAENPTSNSVYTRIGYEQVCGAAVLAFEGDR